MLSLALMLAGQSAATTLPVPDPLLAQMVGLYDDLCLKTFPDDVAVGAAMKKATPLTPDQVKIYLHDDPGVGWRIADPEGDMIVTIEGPPYHACTVRRHTPRGFPDLAAYHAVADPYEERVGGFEPIAPLDQIVGNVHSNGYGETRATLDGGGEALFIFENSPTDPADGPDVEVRFVHQIASPDAK